MRLAVLLLVGLAGCTHTRPADLSSSATRAEVNARAESGHPVLHLDGQRGRQGRSLHFAPDVTTWIDKKTGEARSAPTAEVRAVAFRRDGLGALEGLGIGVDVGGLLGTYLGALDGEGFITYSPLFGTALGVAGGAEVGALVGAVRSDRVVYEATLCHGPVARCPE